VDGGRSAAREQEPGTASQAVGLVADAVGSAVAGIAARLQSPPREPAPPPRAAPRLAAGPVRATTALAATALSRVVSAVLERIDVNAVLDRVDVQRVIARVDVDAVVGRVDLDAAIDTVEPNRLLDRVDIDRLVERVDVGAVARQAIDGVDLPEVVRESTASLGGDALRAARVQAMGADEAVARAVDRLLRRPGPRSTALRPGGEAP